MNEALREITKRSKSHEDADFLNTIFGKFRNEALTGTVPVVLFGAGSAGEKLCPVLKLHGVNPVCFCDNSPSRAGEFHCGLPVISLPELRRHHLDSLIVITTSTYRDEVKKQLLDNGFAKERLLSISNPETMYYYTHLSQWYWPEEDLVLHADELQDVYNLLSDQKSKEIFVSRIALFVRGGDYESYCNFILKFRDFSNSEGARLQETSEAYLQFNNDLIHIGDNEVLVDGGAFTGDSAIEFIKACANKEVKYRGIFCFEPDPKIFAVLKVNTARYDNVVPRPFGLWSHSSTLRFADSNMLKPGSTRIASVYGNNDDRPGGESGNMEICTVSIDEEFPDETVTIIKMDIEGAEIEALRGAMKTIRRCRPRLIVSAYHKRDDLFEIPLLINQTAPNYKIYLRHFSGNFEETTLFAIPY